MSRNLQNLCISLVILACTCLATLGVHAAKTYQDPTTITCDCED